MATRNDRWWADAVVYQIYPRSFADSDGDGIGDLKGIINRLDHLEALGVDVVWLSPIYRSPQADNGYDISDYCDVDPTFGTLEDLDALIAALHDRDMSLLMDLVVNHTSDEHPWFVESRSDTTNPKRDWYWWRPAREGMAPGDPGAEPTNWQSAFYGPAWTLDPVTGEYYLHLFTRNQPDLNWENPAVREAVYDMMRWWLDRGVDGFRMDVINMISKLVHAGGALPDGLVSPGTSPLGDGSPHFTDGPRIHDFLAEMHREVFRDRPKAVLTVGEMPGVTVEEAARYTDPARREIDMVFQFEHMGLDRGATKWDAHPLRLTDLKATMGRWQAGLAEVGWNSLYWDNHDQPRVVSRFGDDGEHRITSATCLATLLHLHRGTPYIYQGEELGMTNAPFAGIEDFADVESLNHAAEALDAGATREDILPGLRAMSRDNARTPMQWDDTTNAGFTTGPPWLAVNPNHTTINAAASVADPDSVFHHHRRLVELRHTDEVVVHGDFTMLLASDEQVYAFTRQLDGATLLTLCNVSGDPAAPEVPDADRWAAAGLALGNLPEPTQPHGRWPGDGTVRLRPWEALVLRLT